MGQTCLYVDVDENIVVEMLQFPPKLLIQLIKMSKEGCVK